MVDKKKREFTPAPKLKQTKNGKDDKPTTSFEESSDEDEELSEPLPLVVDRFDVSDKCRSGDSIDKMFCEINERARTPTLAEELYPYLNKEYWQHPKVKKLGFLFKFNFHHNVGRGCDEIAIRKDNGKLNGSLFAWRALDTPQFIKETLKPIAEDCSNSPTEELLKGVKQKYWDKDNEIFFEKGITRTSPSGEIKIRPYIDRNHPDAPLIRWFMEIPSILTLKSADSSTEWNGYRMKNTLEQFLLIIYKIQQVYVAYLEQKKNKPNPPADQDDCD